MRRVLLLVVLTSAVWAAAAARVDGQRGDVRLPVLSFDAALARAGELPRLHSLLVSLDGELVLEEYVTTSSSTVAEDRPATAARCSDWWNT